MSSFEIGGLSFDYLSGPKSLVGLFPVDKLYQYCDEKTSIPPMLGVGDIHGSLDNGCESQKTCKAEPHKCLAFYTPAFFKLLDAMCDSDTPIDIFLEIGFYQFFLKDSSFFDDSRVNIFQANEGMITWIAKYHPSCFSTADDNQDKCLTQNIRYHLIDIRYNPDFVHFRPGEMEQIYIANVMMKHPSFADAKLIDIYKMAKLYRKYFNNPDVLKKTMRYEPSVKEHFLMFDFGEILREDKLLSGNSVMTPQHLPTFESFLFYIITEAYDIESPQEDPVFFTCKASELIRMIHRSPRECILALMAMPAWKTKSMCYKRMNESIMSKQLCTEMIVDYFDYRMRQWLTDSAYIRESLMNTYRSIPAVKEEWKNKSKKVMPHPSTMTESRAQDNLYERAKIIYKAGIELSEAISQTFMDIYFLLSNWKTNNANMMSVLLAGNNHITDLTRFLVHEKKWYEAKFEMISMEDTFDPDTFTATKHEYLMRCIQPSNTTYVSLTTCLLSYYLDRDDVKYNVLIEKAKLQKKRVDILSQEHVNNVMMGYALKVDLVKRLMKKYETTVTPDELGLKLVLVPTIYSHKRR